MSPTLVFYITIFILQMELQNATESIMMSENPFRQAYFWYRNALGR